MVTRWCQQEHQHLADYEEGLRHPDLITDLHNRNNRWYTKKKFTNCETTVPFRAIDFICREIAASDHQDTRFLLEHVNYLIAKKAGPQHPLTDAKGNVLPASDQPPSVSSNSTTDEKAAWFSFLMKLAYSDGYITKSTGIFGGSLHILIFLMSHGAYWLPDRAIHGTLLLFVQNKGAGAFLWDSAKYLFPNPECDSSSETIPLDFNVNDEVSKMIKTLCFSYVIFADKARLKISPSYAVYWRP